MSKNKRIHHYINADLQNRLIISLIVLELILISVSVWLVYQDMSQTIEDNMFRTHIQNTLSIEYFAERLLFATFMLLIVNLVIVSFVVWLWHFYINSIVIPLRKIVESIYALDFTLKTELPAHHEAVTVADQWLYREKDRFTKIRILISNFDIDNTQNMQGDLERCKLLIKENFFD